MVNSELEPHAYCPVDQQIMPMSSLYKLSFGEIVRCEGCGLVRFYPNRSPEELAEVHSAPDYFDHPYFDARRALSDKRIHQKYQALLRRIIGEPSAAGKTMLDVGCDVGTLLALARDEFGLVVEGVEVSAKAAQVAAEKYGLTVHVGLVNDLNLPDEHFDFISLIDVIEHVSDPLDLLNQLQRILKPGGHLYMATADHDALINGIGRMLYQFLGRYSFPILEKLYIPYHEYYFTQATLAQLVRNANYEIVSHTMREFPLDEFGHGRILKYGLTIIFMLQKLLGRQTLQEIIVRK